MFRTALITLVAICIFCLAATLGPGVRADTDDVLVIGIQVSPYAILIGGDQALYVTVHTEIPYNLVDKDLAITLDGVDVSYTKSDLCGDLVAKFLSDEVKGQVSPGLVTLTLSGTTIDGDLFTGSCEVRVVEFTGGNKGAAS